MIWKKYIKITLVVTIFVLLEFSCSNSTDSEKKTTSLDLVSQTSEIVVYKNASCGCCTKWVEHMRTSGFRLTEKSVPNLSEIKDSLGVPKDKRGCHTAVMGKHVFEGHVPATSVRKFLSRSGGAKGLVVPGMPIGSPGMENGRRKEKFNVYSFDEKGRTKIFDSH